MTTVQKTKEWAWKNINWETAASDDIAKVIQAGGDVNDIGWEGDVCWRDVKYKEHTPLSEAIICNNVTAVKYLLEHHADPNAIIADRYYHHGDREIRDSHIFSLALSSKNQEIIDLFFQHGVDPYAFDPSVAAKNVLENYRDGFYVNGPNTREYNRRSEYERHPIYTAIKVDNLEALKKMTMAPFTVPEVCIQRISGHETGKYATDTSRYWAAFVDQEQRKVRQSLREKLFMAYKKGDRAEQLKTLIQLRGLIPSDKEKMAVLIDDGAGDCIDEIFEMIDQKRQLRNAGIHSPRDHEAEEYTTLKEKYGSETARVAHKSVQLRRAKTLERQ